MEVVIHSTAESSSHAAAGVIANLIQRKPDAVLGLATGTTPLPLYAELIRMHREANLDFSGVTTFNLDEYVGLSAGHKQSYHYFMQEHLFRHINVNPDRTHLPDGMTCDIPGFCKEYEQAISRAGGIDLQVLGIGSDGHIGFNEPTSSFASRTRIKTLTRETVEDNARLFGGRTGAVPRHCITMGIGTIMEARTTVLLAHGSHKADAATAAIEGPVAAMVPASILQHHPDARVFLDEGAASSLQLKEYYEWVYARKPDWQRTA